MRPSRWLSYFGALYLWAAFSSPAQACDCGIWTREQAISRSPAAFKGLVLTTRRITAADDISRYASYPPVFISRVKVLYRLHGGPIADEVNIVSGTLEQTSCGDFSLDKSEGQTFIFLGEVPRNGPGSTGPCSLFGPVE
jgi:hypothetical protein